MSAPATYAEYYASQTQLGVNDIELTLNAFSTTDPAKTVIELNASLIETRDVMPHGYVTFSKKDSRLLLLHRLTRYQPAMGQPEEGWFPDQRLTIEEAIDAYTRAPAWACFEEDTKGTLSVGKLADIAVFDTNLVEAGHVDPARLLEAQVLYTVVGGDVVFER